MLLRTLKAVNFRLLEQFALEFRDDVTVLIGANNAGKSNVIDALLMPCDALLLNSYFDALRQRHGVARVISGHDLSSTLTLAFEFSGDEAALEYSVEIDSASVIVESRRTADSDVYRANPVGVGAPALAQGSRWSPFAGFFEGIIHIDPFRRVDFKAAIGPSAVVRATGDDLAQVLHYHHNNDREHFE